MPGDFTLDMRLEEDSVFVAALPLCDMRLMKERRWFWLLLVPRVKKAEEIFDLSAAQRVQLIKEINFVAEQLHKAAESCDKINIGALGNIVRQLHIHIIARVKGDAVWPNPIWGQGARQESLPEEGERRLAAIKGRLAGMPV